MNAPLENTLQAPALPRALFANLASISPMPVLQPATTARLVKLLPLQGWVFVTDVLLVVTPVRLLPLRVLSAALENFKRSSTARRATSAMADTTLIILEPQITTYISAQEPCLIPPWDRRLVALALQVHMLPVTMFTAAWTELSASVLLRKLIQLYH